MNTIFDITVVKPKGGGKTMRKIVDLPFTPFVGMRIEDHAWNDPKEVKYVCLSISEDGQHHLYVPLGLHKAKDSDQMEQLVEMYGAHGWKALPCDD